MGYDFGLGYEKKDVITHRTQTWTDQKGITRRCIKHCVRGNVLWTVWEHSDGEREIGCDLMRKDKGFGWGSKAMCERNHPFDYSCPVSYLDMVPVACQEWRDKVYARAAKGKGAQVGDRVTLTRSALPYLDIVSLHPLRGIYQGKLYKLPKRFIA